MTTNNGHEHEHGFGHEDDEPAIFTCSWCGEEQTDEPTLSDGSTELCEDCAYDAVCCLRCSDVVAHNESHYSECYEDYYCDECFYDTHDRCEYCEEYHHVNVILHYDSVTLCEHCRDYYYTVCDRCGDAVHDDWIIYRESHEEYYCSSCDPGEDYYEDDSRDVSADVEAGTVRYAPSSFGVEIETEFPNGGCPFRLGGYHSGATAEAEHFFGGWRAESDCSLDYGGEFISPPLSGAEGIAEIIATMNVLSEHGAKMRRSCGQHVTVQCLPRTDDYYGTSETQMQVQRLALALEETLLATTGSYFRLNHHYCERIKKSYRGMDSAKEKRMVHGRTITVGIKENGLVEFRYPPGTLVAEQVAVNVGLTQLVCHIAATASEEEIDALVAEAIELASRSDLSEPERIHLQITMGLSFLASYGWSKHGDMTGLPYDPTDAPTVNVVDHERGHDVTVELPGRDAIIKRMERQIGRFYNKMGMGFTLDSTEAMTILATGRAL